jgi:hypothetical protein
MAQPLGTFQLLIDSFQACDMDLYQQFH